MYKEDMAKSDVTDKIVLELLQEIKGAEYETEETKPFYAKFPREVWDEFEANVSPMSPTKALLGLMLKLNKKARKK